MSQMSKNVVGVIVTVLLVLAILFSVMVIAGIPI